MKSRNGGYTILEALIFLAVSGMLFALVYPNFASRDNNNKFSESVNDMTNKINDVINDVATGYYPAVDVGCNAVGVDNNRRVQFNDSGGSNSAQGTRQSCIFVGKVVTFNNSSPSIDVETMVGIRETGRDDSGVSPKTVSDARPAAVDPDSSLGSLVDATETFTSKWNVPITSVWSITPPPPAAPAREASGSLAIMLNLGGTNLSSSSKNLDLYSITENTVPNINIRDSNDFANNWRNLGKYVICMDDPNSNKIAAVIVDSVNGTKARAVFENIDTEAGVADVCVV